MGEPRTNWPPKVGGGASFAVPVMLAFSWASDLRAQEQFSDPESGVSRSAVVSSESAFPDRSLFAASGASAAPPSSKSIGPLNSGAAFEAPSSSFAAPPSPYTSALPSAPLAPEFVEELLYNPLQWGPFRVIPAVNYRFSYSTGLPYGGVGSANETTAQHTISPSLTLQSEHVTLNYFPSLNYYSKGRYEDSLNHSASIRSAFGYGDWAFSISHAYSAASQVLVESARQTDTESHGTSLGATYRLSENTSIQLTASQSISETSEFNSSTTWSTMNWVDFQITDVTRLGVGAGGGYTDVEQGSDMTYQQVQGRINWVPRPKISAALNGGIEIRQFLAQQGVDDQVNPIMGASATYRPFDYTSLTLSANRGVSSSIFSDQITETTSFALSLGQRLIERLQVGLSGGLRYADFQSSSQLLNVNRSDEVHFFSASLSTRFLKRATASIGYSLSSNKSNNAVYEYDSYTYSAQIGYSF